MSGQHPEWLRELRAQARARFDSAAWPTPEDEDWRRTELGLYDLSPFLAEPDADLGGQLCPWAGEPGGAAGFIRFDAGSCAELGFADRLQARGARLESIGMGSLRGEELVSSFLLEAFASARDKVEAWHFARLEYGAFLYLPPGLKVEEPFLVEFEERGSGRYAGGQVAIVLGEGASATVVVKTRGEPGSTVLCNSRTDVSLGPGASLRLFDSQALAPESLHFQRSRAVLAEGSSLERLEVQLGAKLAMTRVDCLLEGRGADAKLEGLYYRGSGQEADVGTQLRHLSPGATSRATYKGAVQGGGRSVYNGLIDVAQGASGTDAYLANRNLLLGEAARADSIPTLRIGNNDVRCSHGSATGRLGEEELFYLRTRGFSEAEAREMLVLGFFDDLLERSPAAFREETLDGVRRRLPAAA